MPRLLRSARRSEDDSTPTSLVESIRRATNQPARQSKKPYSRGEEAGSSKQRKSTTPHLPTHIPELGLLTAPLNSYSKVTEPNREFQPNHTRYSYLPESMYPHERTVTRNQEWSMTPPNSMSPATSVDSPPLLDSPASATNPWVPFVPSPDSRLSHQDSRVAYAPSYPNLFDIDYRYSQANEYTDETRIVSSAIDEETEEKYIYLDHPTALSPLNELGLRPYGAAAELDTLANALTWEVLDEGGPFPF